MEYVIEGITYLETDDKAEIGDYVVSSEQIEQPRIYKVYHTTESKFILGRYSRGHTNLWDYKVLKPKIS